MFDNLLIRKVASAELLKVNFHTSFRGDESELVGDWAAASSALQTSGG